MPKTKLPVQTIRKLRYNIEKYPAIFLEPHIGEKTFDEPLYSKFLKVQKRTKAVSFFSGDLLNAEDLRDKGILTEECIFDQIDEFRRRFRGLPIRLIMQQNHGSRMGNRQIPRQLGETITNRWKSVLNDFEKENQEITILDLDEGFVEIEFVNNSGKVLSRGLLYHPIGVSSTNSWNSQLAMNFSGYDFIYNFHFHKKEEREQCKRSFGNVLETTDVQFIPPFIADPRYGINKGFPPIHTGFLFVKYDKQLEKITTQVIHNE
jgi:hypothetical protein